MQTLEDSLLNVYQVPEGEMDAPEGEQKTERFKLQNDDMANWALRKVASARRRAAQAKSIADTEMQRIQNWLDKEKANAAKEEAFFTSLLASYFRPQHEANPKKKTFKLPAGSVQFKVQEPEFTKDEPVLMAWLKENMPEMVETKEFLKWGDLKEKCEVTNGQVVVKETGEIVPGVTITERPKKVNVGVD